MVKVMSTILIIDDQKPIRNALREILEFEKYTIEEAADGFIGLEMIGNKNYDLVFCDIKMPRLDGLEFLKKVSNIIFIRDPKEIINSYSKIIPNPTIEDIGIKQQFKLYNHLIETNNDPVVLDSSILLKNPEKILEILS